MAPLGSCLVSALASMSALIGKTTLQVFPSYKEKGKLFFIAWRNIGPDFDNERELGDH